MNKVLIALVFLLALAVSYNRVWAAAPTLEPARFGAVGDGKSHPVGTAYGGTLMLLAAHAGEAGSRPFAWVVQPAFGLTFTRATDAGQAQPGRDLHFASAGGSIEAAGQIVMPGMTASADCLPRGDMVRSVDGTVVSLERPSAVVCAAGTVVVFAANVSSLEADWLGLQAAIVAAHDLPAGGAVHIPAGTYLVDRPLLNPPATLDKYSLGQQVDEYGDGVAQTRIVFTRDLGPGACGFGEANRGIGSNTRGRIRDLRLIGPGTAMDGFCIGAKQLLRRVRADGFHAGVNVLEDHWEIQDSEFAGNFYGIYLAPGGDTFGNGVLRDVFPVGNHMASIAVASSNVLDSATLHNVHLGFSPYGFYREAKPGGGVVLDGFISNSLLENVWGEDLGNGYIFGENGVHDRVQHNVWINSSPVMGLGGTYRLKDRRPSALVTVGAWIENEMINSDFGNPNNYHEVLRALIEARENIQGNSFGRAPDMVGGSSAAKPALVAPVVLSNSFGTGQVAGRFMVATKPVAAGAVLSEAGFDRTEPALPGRAVAGVAISSAAGGGVVAVADRGLVRVDKQAGVLRAGDRLGSAPDDPSRVAVVPAGSPAFAAAWEDAADSARDVTAYLGALSR